MPNTRSTSASDALAGGWSPRRGDPDAARHDVPARPRATWRASGNCASPSPSAVAAPDTYVTTLLGYLQEQRDVTWARVTPENLTDPLPEPTEDELQAYYEANEAAFTLGETKVITYAQLTPDMLVGTVEIDAGALEAAYQERIDDFVQPERRLVERLVFPTEAEAAQAKAAIDAGETTFDALVEERGLTLEDIDMGEATVESLEGAGAAIFALTEPGVAGPLPSALGPALFRMNAILSAQEIPLEEAEEILRGELAADRARRVIDESVSQIDDLLAGGATLEDLAAETEMELGQIDWRAETPTRASPPTPPSARPRPP
jgi:peptidyl-prolyl cis-trans isomerase D